jgi:hypothetical protein
MQQRHGCMGVLARQINGLLYKARMQPQLVLIHLMISLAAVSATSATASMPLKFAWVAYASIS